MTSDQSKTIDECLRQWQGRFALPAPAAPRKRSWAGPMIAIGILFACAGTIALLAAGPTPYPKEASVLVPPRPVEKPRPVEFKIELPTKELADKIGGLGSTLTAFTDSIKSAAARPPIDRVAQATPPPAPVPDKPPELQPAPPTQPPAQPTAPPTEPPRSFPPADAATDPMIVVDVPTSRPAGKIIVVKCTRSSNVSKMLVDIQPPPAADDVYQSADGKEFVFSVPDEGTWTIRVIASSPNGGLDQVVRQVQVGEAVAGNGPAKPASMVRNVELGPVDYGKWIAKNAGLVKSPNRKADFIVMAGAYSATDRLIGTKGIRDIGELDRYLNGQMDGGLGLYPDGRPGPELEACAEFRKALDQLTKNDFRFLDLTGARSGLTEITTGLLRASR